MDHNKKTFLLSIPFLLFGLYGCGNWNIKTGTSDISMSGSGMVDQTTRDIIRSEYDAQGNLLSCTVGRSSRRRDLPSCNQIITERSKANNQKSEQELKNKRKASDEFFRKRILGKKTFNFSSGLQLRAETEVKYNLNTNQLIINTELIRKSGDKEEFKSIFIDKKARIFLSFLDANNFELLEPLIIPLNIYDGQAAGVIYRKKGSKNIDEIGGMRILARRQINSLDEFKRIRKIELSIKL